MAAGTVTLVTRPIDKDKTPSQVVRVGFTAGPSSIVRRMTDAAGKPVEQVTLEAPLLTALAPGPEAPLRAVRR